MHYITHTHVNINWQTNRLLAGVFFLFLRMAVQMLAAWGPAFFLTRIGIEVGMRYGQGPSSHIAQLYTTLPNFQGEKGGGGVIKLLALGWVQQVGAV